MASEKVLKLIEDVKVLTVLELSELVKALEEEFGVSAAAPAAAAAAARSSSTAATATTKRVPSPSSSRGTSSLPPSRSSSRSLPSSFPYPSGDHLRSRRSSSRGLHPSEHLGIVEARVLRGGWRGSSAASPRSASAELRRSVPGSCR